MGQKLEKVQSSSKVKKMQGELTKKDREEILAIDILSYSLWVMETSQILKRFKLSAEKLLNWWDKYILQTSKRWSKCVDCLIAWLKTTYAICSKSTKLEQAMWSLSNSTVKKQGMHWFSLIQKRMQTMQERTTMVLW